MVKDPYANLATLAQLREHIAILEAQEGKQRRRWEELDELSKFIRLRAWRDRPAAIAVAEEAEAAAGRVAPNVMPQSYQGIEGNAWGRMPTPQGYGPQRVW